MLFLVFIGDFPEVFEVLIKLFADDTKVYDVVSNQTDNSKFQNSLNRAINWTTIWKMLFDNIKCHHLRVDKYDRETKYTITSINQERELEEVKH